MKFNLSLSKILVYSLLISTILSEEIHKDLKDANITNKANNLKKERKARKNGGFLDTFNKAADNLGDNIKEGANKLKEHIPGASNFINSAEKAINSGIDKGQEKINDLFGNKQNNVNTSNTSNTSNTQNNVSYGGYGNSNGNTSMEQRSVTYGNGSDTSTNKIPFPKLKESAKDLINEKGDDDQSNVTYNMGVNTEKNNTPGFDVNKLPKKLITEVSPEPGSSEEEKQLQEALARVSIKYLFKAMDLHDSLPACVKSYSSVQNGGPYKYILESFVKYKESGFSNKLELTQYLKECKEITDTVLTKFEPNIRVALYGITAKVSNFAGSINDYSLSVANKKKRMKKK